ncbi:uncharacterized protein V1516DRAFT_542083 [Lipomyces oligophaga]|uniref:uncharacterized protein n=1 Tax=Lipomyces oligophaga TaxID=45792 RepID=UPI0034CEA73C
MASSRAILRMAQSTAMRTKLAVPTAQRALFVYQARRHRSGDGLSPETRSFTDFPNTKSDERLAGDYPELPYEYHQHRDPYAKYDMQQLRRNFNEPLHEDDDMINMWSPDVHDVVPSHIALRFILGFFAVFSATAYGLSFAAPERPSIPRVYADGLYKELGGADDFKDIFVVDDGTVYNFQK